MGKRPDLFDQMDEENDASKEGQGSTAPTSPKKTAWPTNNSNSANSANNTAVSSVSANIEASIQAGGSDDIKTSENSEGKQARKAKVLDNNLGSESKIATEEGETEDKSFDAPVKEKKKPSILVVSSDQEEVPAIEIGDLGDDELFTGKEAERKTVTPMVVKEMTTKKKATGSAIVLVGAGTGIARPVKGRRRKKKKKITTGHILITLAFAIVMFVMFLPKAPEAAPPGQTREVEAAKPAYKATIPTDASGQPLILSGVPTPENSGRPVQIMAYLELNDPDCMSCMMPLAVLRSWWAQDSARRALRVVVVSQDETTKKKLEALGVTSWPALVLKGPNGIRTLSGEGALQDVFDSTRVVDSAMTKRIPPH